MFHFSKIPQPTIDRIAVALVETIEEGGKLIPESHLYLALQNSFKGLSMDDWQAISMAMVATKRVTLKRHAFEVAKPRIRKAVSA